jgi:hypothetical protein
VAGAAETLAAEIEAGEVTPGDHAVFERPEA